MKILSLLQRTLFRKRQAYRHIFQPGGNLGPAAQIVLTDLRKFCRATSTPAVVSPISGNMDPMATGVAIGRLEVWHRITQHLHLNDADLYKSLVEQPQDTGPDE